MKLTPREKDKLLISVAAEVARKRLKRGLKLNYPEVIAIISDYVVEGEDPKLTYVSAARSKQNLKVTTMLQIDSSKEISGNKRFQKCYFQECGKKERNRLDLAGLQTFFLA